MTPSIPHLATLTLTLGLALFVPPQAAPVAVLNGQPITLEEYGAYLIETVGKRPLRGLINRKLVALEADRLGIVADEATLRGAFEEVEASLLERWQGDADKVAEELRTQGFTLDEYRRLVEGAKRHEVLCAGICRLTREVTPATIRAKFEETYGPGGRRVELRHIFLSSGRVEEELRKEDPALPTPARVHAEIQKRIDELLEKLAAGADFAELAREHSHHRLSSRLGGVLNSGAAEFSDAAFASAVRSAAVGLPAGPAFTADGAHLIEVTSRVTTRFEDVSETLAQELREAPASYQEIGALEERLFAAAKVEGL